MNKIKLLAILIIFVPAMVYADPVYIQSEPTNGTVYQAKFGGIIDNIIKPCEADGSVKIRVDTLPAGPQSISARVGRPWGDTPPGVEIYEWSDWSEPDFKFTLPEAPSPPTGFRIVQ